MPEDNSVKILFRFYSNILDEETSETLFGEVVNQEFGYYKIAKIPFYAPKLAMGDVVWAEHNQREGVLTYRKTVQHSGNSTVQVILMGEGYEIDEIRGVFNAMGCASEKLNPQYFSMDVPSALDYHPVKLKLVELENDKIVDYAESCLSEKHQYKNVSSDS
ncbi:MAG: DUF4265 domain-containing protein [Sphingobacteriales bacterium]